MVTALYKNLKPFYTWGDSISKKKIQNNYVSLPVDSNKNLDFDTIDDRFSLSLAVPPSFKCIFDYLYIFLCIRRNKYMYVLKSSF